MLSIDEALAIIIDKAPQLPIVELPLAGVTGRFLRRDVISDLDLPPFDRARMDGYAFSASSTVGSPVTLREVGEVAAGEAYSGEVGLGEAVRIMTGAPVPDGADAVERIEVIAVHGDGTIGIPEQVAAGKNVTPRGHEVRAGQVVIESGVRITPAISAVLATFGRDQVAVSRPPRVALVSTGSELVPVDRKPGPGQIRDSNSYALAGYLAEVGGEVVSSSVVTDDLRLTIEAISSALTVADVIILSGGVSMGDYDLVKPALRELGAKIPFERVSMHPGKPTVFATIGEKLLFGLPGNPVSVAVSFHLFARPALLKMQGAGEIDLPRCRLRITRRVKGAPPRRSHQPGRVRIDDGQAVIEPLRWSGSGDLVGFMHADALFVIPEDRACVEAGELVEAIILP